ncbi:MAG: molecular chaperone DjiA, partial [Marinirhabdus sp.]
MVRWLLAVVGYMVYRFPGALLGFFAGTFLDNVMGNKRGGGTFGRVFQQRGDRVSPADFELNLLSLASLVIK